MKIDGKILAAEILSNLKKDLKKVKTKIVPHLAVFQIGNDLSSLSFIKQKKIAAKHIKANITVYHYRKIPDYQKIACDLLNAASNPDVHGIIIQRPLPPSLSAEALTKRIGIEKDVDGFLAKSLFYPPVAIAVFKILNEIYFAKMLEKTKPENVFDKSLLSYFKNKKIVLLGRGETAGKPIAELINKKRLNFINLNSLSTNCDEYLKQADLIVSCVGKSNIFNVNQIKNGTILIGVGIHKAKGKLIGDYQEKEIKDIAGFYTPTPGGVGPVNVACLMENLVTAYKYQLKIK